MTDKEKMEQNARRIALAYKHEYNYKGDKAPEILLEITGACVAAAAILNAPVSNIVDAIFGSFQFVDEDDIEQMAQRVRKSVGGKI